MTTWEEAQQAELSWWGDCTNTYAEEQAQLIAAERMGLNPQPGTTGPVIETRGTIADVGGGPVSLLLKSHGWDRGIVVDPSSYPEWTLARYKIAGIEVIRDVGEYWVRHTADEPDEVWIYNTLQHVADPEALVAGAVRLAPVVRLFEWTEFEVNECHIHVLHGKDISLWLSSAGAEVDSLTESIEFGGSDNLSYRAIARRA